MAQPVVADPADISLELAVDALFDAYALTPAERKLLLRGAALPELEEAPPQHEPGEACHAAVLHAATAVEARLNRVFGPFDLESSVNVGPPVPIDPRTARAMVETCVLICTFLSTLVGEAASETERCAQHVAVHLKNRELTLPSWYDEWDSSDFPPNILGS